MEGSGQPETKKQCVHAWLGASRPRLHELQLAPAGPEVRGLQLRLLRPVHLVRVQALRSLRPLPLFLTETLHTPMQDRTVSHSGYEIHGSWFL